MDLYIKLSVKTTNITNKLLDKPRESEWGGGGVQTHNNFKYCIRPFWLVAKERNLGRRLKYSSFIYLFIYFILFTK